MNEIKEKNSVNIGNRLAKNTIYLYIRMLFLMFVSLYSSRVLLNVLGFDGFGLYSVVAGFVTMFSFLSSTLATSTQRFLIYELGKGNDGRPEKIFSNSLILHIILALLVFVLSESIGVWYINNRLVVEEGRLYAANMIFQFSVFSICLQILQLPYLSTVIAHERMKIYSYISIFEGISKLAILFTLGYFIYDPVIIYAILLFLVQLLIFLLYLFTCLKRFNESHFKYDLQKDVFKDLLGFTGWNLIGNFANVCNAQGISLVLNYLFGTVINAARGVSFQVNGLSQQLIGNFQIAVKPQVVRYYAQGEIEKMIDLIIQSAKYSAFLIIIVNIPIIVEVIPILDIWLGNYPSYTDQFIQIVLVQSIISSMTGCIIMGVHATGYLKNVGICGGILLLMVLPISYLFTKYIHQDPLIPFYVNLLAAIIEPGVELYWLNKYVRFPIISFYKRVYLPAIILALMSYVFTFMVARLIIVSKPIMHILLVTTVSVLFTCTIVYAFLLPESMRKRTNEFIKSKIKI